jgi:hypothetical protein
MDRDSHFQFVSGQGRADNSKLAIYKPFTTVSLSLVCVQVGKSFLQNEGGYRDGSKHQKGKNGIPVNRPETDGTVPIFAAMSRCPANTSLVLNFARLSAGYGEGVARSASGRSSASGGGKKA